MKLITNYIAIIFCSIILISCGNTISTLSNGKQIDSRLAGEWTGSETDNQIEGMKKEWVMTRNNDGTFVLDFTFTKDGETNKTIETGNWWIQDGKFYEAHSESGLTDIYTYQVLDKNQIKFKSVNISIGMNKESYEFIDTRKASAKVGNSTKDGSSYEKAIKVKSVADEYKYVKEHCEGCQMGSQSLSEYKGKMYDVLHLKKSDGSDVSYYFDINSFYGKW
ncbi:hypothetical protein [Epilithonimonas sp. UC225_85]|uniref:hypothetical protein n=1 Tax=Epilithonimonas sp. UC225_85 TaxID=3350167 RepID=UPI0036D2190E